MAEAPRSPATLSSKWGCDQPVSRPQWSPQRSVQTIPGLWWKGLRGLVIFRAVQFGAHAPGRTPKVDRSGAKTQSNPSKINPSKGDTKKWYTRVTGTHPWDRPGDSVQWVTNVSLLGTVQTIKVGRLWRPTTFQVHHGGECNGQPGQQRWGATWHHGPLQ